MTVCVTGIVVVTVIRFVTCCVTVIGEIAVSVFVTVTSGMDMAIVSSRIMFSLSVVLGNVRCIIKIVEVVKTYGPDGIGTVMAPDIACASTNWLHPFRRHHALSHELTGPCDNRILNEGSRC